MPTFSDIDYDAHVQEAKNDAIFFTKNRRHYFKVLRPISEDDN